MRPGRQLRNGFANSIRPILETPCSRPISSNATIQPSTARKRPSKKKCQTVRNGDVLRYARMPTPFPGRHRGLLSQVPIAIPEGYWEGTGVADEGREAAAKMLVEAVVVLVAALAQTATSGPRGLTSRRYRALTTPAAPSGHVRPLALPGRVAGGRAAFLWRRVRRWASIVARISCCYRCCSHGLHQLDYLITFKEFEILPDHKEAQTKFLTGHFMVDMQRMTGFNYAVNTDGSEKRRL